MLRLSLIAAMAGNLAMCAESYPKLVSRQPKAEMLQEAPCEPPGMPPAAPTRKEIDGVAVSNTQSALCFQDKFNALVDFTKAGPK